jgi:hypothetical protein
MWLHWLFHEEQLLVFNIHFYERSLLKYIILAGHSILLIAVSVHTFFMQTFIKYKRSV